MLPRIESLVETLHTAGLWPRGISVGDVDWTATAAAPADLLPVLQIAWRAAAKRNPRIASNRVAQWLDRIANTFARMTIDVPDSTIAANWLGTRLAWWPRGIPAGRRVGLASSRIGRALETHAAWFTYLRAACAKADPEQDILFTAAESTTARFVERCARLFGQRVLRTDVAADDESWKHWGERIVTQPVAVADTSHELYLSPPLPETVPVNEVEQELWLIPARDRALVALSDRLLVFHVRGGGNLERLLRARLNDPAWPVASVFVAIGPQLVSRKLTDELLKQGAVGWLLLENLQADPPKPVVLTLPSDPPPVRTIHSRKAAPIIAAPSSGDWQFLTHCTRRQNARWSDESEEEFIDNLILRRDEADHSAFAALARIAATQRLQATSKAVRGGFPVVSFTAAPLADLPRLRVFRPHRGRWDFEPYGICIRRDWLQRLDCRAVRYGDDVLWQSFAAEDRPFFQKSRSGKSREKPAIDWTVEQEWRHIGDVDLTKLRDDEAFVFVPTRDEAERLARVSRWPIVVAEG